MSAAQTPRLGLPLLSGGQAQKHIVVNDAFLDIDHLLHARLISRNTGVQPLSPQEGDLYMIPAGAAGAVWSGFSAGQIVRFFDGFWYILNHPEGTVLYVADENRFLCKSAHGWAYVDTLISDLQNLEYLGLGTIADAANPLVAHLNSALFGARSVDEGGTGDLRLNLNKSGHSHIVSVQLKEDFIAKAEFGLLGDDSFTLKMSQDGSAWIESFCVTTAGNVGIGTRNPAKKLDLVGSDALINGLTLGRGGADLSQNTALGNGALASNSSGLFNTAIGHMALNANSSASQSVAVGYNALAANSTGANNTAVGYNVLAANTTGANNTALGRSALATNTTGANNTVMGYLAMYANTTGGQSVALGREALNANSTGANNTAVGYKSMLLNTSGTHNTAIGYSCLSANTTGGYNTAMGLQALLANSTGDSNTAVGHQALSGVSTQTYCTAVGRLAGATSSYNNVACLGYNAQVTGANQVQLGDATTTTYVYGTVQNRSDARDKADIRDTVLGLDFILALRPVDYRLDMREDYRTPPPDFPDGEMDEASEAAYRLAVNAWSLSNSLANIEHDGSHKRTRFHSGLIAQEVATVIEAAGVNWGGLQDHSYNGGDAVMSLGYTQFIAPLIKAVQQLSARLAVLEGVGA